MLYVVRAAESLKKPFRQKLPLYQIDDLNRGTVHAVCKQKYLEVGTLNVLVKPGLPNGNAAECFQVNREMMLQSRHTSPISSRLLVSLARCHSNAFSGVETAKLTFTPIIFDAKSHHSASISES